MCTQISPARYKGAEGYRLSRDGLSVTVLRQGAKVQSIRWNQREWLCQQPHAEFKYSAYGDDFTTGEFSGFDDMFPNISAGPYPDAPWEGIPLPDHGEVWSRPWDCRAEGQALQCRTEGVALPYLLEKRVALTGDALRLSYHLQNTSASPLCYLWAAHPLFVLEDGMRLLLPGCKEIFNACPNPAGLGDFGDIHPWPVSLAGRDMQRLDAANHTFHKYYVWNDLQENKSILQYPDGTRITLEAPVAQVPYLGVWIDEDGYGIHRMRCAAPEPCTGSLDRLDLAREYGKESILPPHGETRWTLTISFTKE